MRRAGLGRYAGLSGDRAGDPLEGLVNLFDLAIVLAVGFLLAALGSLGLEEVLTREQSAQRVREAIRQGDQGAVPLPGVPAGTATARGQGTPVGTVYRLSDGRIVYVEREAGEAGRRPSGPAGATGSSPAPGRSPASPGPKGGRRPPLPEESGARPGTPDGVGAPPTRSEGDRQQRP